MAPAIWGPTMRWLDAVAPVPMRRVAIVAPEDRFRAVLVKLAGAGVVEISVPDDAVPPYGSADPADRAALAATPPDRAALERAGRSDLLAGERQLDVYAAAALRRSGAAALAGWIPAGQLTPVAARLAGDGGALVPLPPPRGTDPPTLLAARKLSPLVQTYGTVPYEDVDPSWLAWGSYVLMFGMMFGDVGEGALLMAAAAALWAGWPRWTRRFRETWPFVGGAGLAATAFGLLYGECFGPTGLVPALWLDPLAEPFTLMAAALGVGAVLLAGAYVLGVVNRRREGGWAAALYAPSGIAGAGLLGGAGLLAAGWRFHGPALLVAGGVLAAAGLVLAFAGFISEAGGGGAGRMQASVELFDLVVRLGSNVVSFTRLAAFGLTHAALGLLVWQGTRALWQHGGFLAVAAAVLFVAGTLLAFTLEALVAAVQALRLEYYELFSRVFVAQGRPFRPWSLPVIGDGEAEEGST